MAEKGKGDKTRYHTSVGDFEEIRPGVYVSDTVDRKNLSVPGNVSNTKRKIDLPVNPNTVIFTERDIAVAIGNQKANVNLDKDFSLIETFSKVSSPAPGWQAKLIYGEAARRGPLAVENNAGGGMINLSIENRDELVAELAGVPDISHLRIPKAHMEAIGSFVAGHELRHLQDQYGRDEFEEDPIQTLIEEIEGDLGSLKASFNKEFAQTVTDLRALNSLNTANKYSDDHDDHATHIWTEEYVSGLMPSREQAAAILAAPGLIDSKLRELISNTGPGAEMNISEINDRLTSHPEDRVAYLKLFRSMGEFNDIEFGNEFVDKYIAAGDRMYQKEAIAETTLKLADEYIREVISDMSDTKIADDIQKDFAADPHQKYLGYKAVRENGYLDKIPGSSEFIDAYLSKYEKDNPGAKKDPAIGELRQKLRDAEGMETPAAKPVAAAAPAASM